MTIAEIIKAYGDVNGYVLCKRCPLYGNCFSDCDGRDGAYTRIQKYLDGIKAMGKNQECDIKDSGERREFDTGAVRDMATGKGRMDLLPWAAIMEVSKHCENGAIKYGEHNVDKGLPVSSFCDSAARHLAKYIDGWEDEPHLLASAWNLLWAIQMELKHPELKDVPWKGADDGKAD